VQAEAPWAAASGCRACQAGRRYPARSCLPRGRPPHGHCPHDHRASDHVDSHRVPQSLPASKRPHGRHRASQQQRALRQRRARPRPPQCLHQALGPARHPPALAHPRAAPQAPVSPGESTRPRHAADGPHARRQRRPAEPAAAGQHLPGGYAKTHLRRWWARTSRDASLACSATLARMSSLPTPLVKPLWAGKCHCRADCVPRSGWHRSWVGSHKTWDRSSRRCPMVSLGH